MQTSIFSSAERPANRLALPDSEEDWMMTVATWPSNFADFCYDFAQSGLCGKTSPEFCRVEAGEISAPSSGRLANAGMGTATEFSTLSMCEWTGWNGPSRNDEGVCSLSDILETGDHLRLYCLSPKACAGILRRAAKRGKDLPEMLRIALQAAAVGAGREPETREDKTT